VTKICWTARRRVRSQDSAEETVFSLDCNCRVQDSQHARAAGAGSTIKRMANLTLVYGMRLLPADEVAEVGEAPVVLRNGKQAQVTMHVLEGSREQIEAQLKQSIDAFFDFYPEI